MNNKTKIFIFFPLFLSTLCSFVYSQSNKFSFERLSIEQGLSQSSVLSIYEDSHGFLWIGTEDGLNRYDGYKFTIFKNIPNDSTSLRDNRVNSIIEDKNGFLWVGTSGGGLNKFDRNSERFFHYVNNPFDSTSLSNNIVTSIFEDKSGKLWLGTLGGGLNMFDPNKSSFTRYLHDSTEYNSISNNTVYSIIEDHLQVLWVGTWGGLNKFDKGLRQFSCYTHNPNNPLSIGDDKIFSIYEDNSGIIWVGTWGGGLNRFNRSKNNFTRFQNNPSIPISINNDIVLAIYQDCSGDYWLGTFGGGLNIFNPIKNQVIHFANMTAEPNSLSNDRVYRIYEDKSGLVWVGTVGGGLNKFDRKKRQFTHYTYDASNPQSLSNNSVFAFCEDKTGSIWIGTYGGGLNCFNRKLNTFQHFRNNPSDINSISDDGVSAICERMSGELWIGTFGGGLNKFVRETNKFIRFQHFDKDPNSLSDDKISLIYEDKLGTLWIGTLAAGLNKFDDVKKRFVNYKNNPEDSTSLSHNRVYSVFEDKKGVLWVGTFGGGLNKFNKESENFIHFTHNPKDPFSLSNNKIYSIYEDRTGFLWIGTVGGGLNRFDRNNGKFKHFREKDGLANDVIYGILEDDNGNLWISTNKGLSKFNIITEKFRNFDVKDGLQHNEFNQGAYMKNKDGELFFGGINGFNIFHPDSIIDQPDIPHIVITDFQLMHKPVSIGYDSVWHRTILTKSISEVELIELNHYDNVISFEFASLDLRNPDKNKYAYNLEGFNDEWTYTDANRRFVTYTNLDPGEYIFRVKGSNSDYVWNETGTSIKIIIKPPWWKTWWAYFTYTGFLIILIVALRQYDLRRQRLKHQLELEHEHNEKLEEIDRIKSRFFTNISHEFRTPLTLILGPADKIISEIPESSASKQAGIIKRNASRLLDLINQLLDLSKLEAGKLKLEASRSNISVFVRGITMAFESLAEKKDIELRLSLEKQNIEAYFDKDKIQKVLTNILSNAFKFTTEGGKIEVRLQETDHNSVVIKVKDTGMGISAKELPKIFDMFYQADGSSTREQQGSGIGLALTKELIELHRGKINIDSKEGEWTEVQIELPLGREHLKDEEIIEEEKELKEEFEIPITDYSSDISEETEIEKFESDKNIVLVVEDNNDVREYIKDSIIKDYDVVDAINGEQGLRKAEKYIPDLIIGDIMMPKMDGYEMTKRIKQDEKTSHIPIILLTAKSDKESKLEGLELGADDYLTKPFDTKELLARMKNLIESRKRIQQKFSTGAFEIKSADKPRLSAIDEKFIEKILTVINEHLSEEEFSIEDIAMEIGMSRAQIYRKIKALTGKSPSLYLRSVRLSKAKEMIKEGKGTISEISFWVGFSSPAYFSRCYKEEYGYPPSDQI